MTPSTAAASTRAATPTSSSSGGAHQLIIEAVACWLGGVWSDAEGASEEARGTDAERRCSALVAKVYGSDDEVRTKRLRAVEALEVAQLKDKVLGAARGDAADAPRAQELGKLFDALADTARETMYARRAGDRVKKDIAGEREAGKLSRRGRFRRSSERQQSIRGSSQD